VQWERDGRELGVSSEWARSELGNELEVRTDKCRVVPIGLHAASTELLAETPQRHWVDTTKPMAISPMPTRMFQLLRSRIPGMSLPAR
jgi:hypothetical protein